MKTKRGGSNGGTCGDMTTCYQSRKVSRNLQWCFQWDWCKDKQTKQEGSTSIKMVKECFLDVEPCS